MLIRIHPETPQERMILQVADILRNDGVIIYPTDTVYGIGCDIRSKKAFERMCQIKGIRPEKATFACICEDLKILSEYTLHVSTPMYKILRRALPGPYTFILEASKQIPKHFLGNRKTVGIRVSDHAIPHALVKELGNPISHTSLRKQDDIEEYTTDPELIHERYGHLVDAVIDGGYGQRISSTVIDMSRGEYEIEVLREGLGSLDVLGMSVG